MATAPDADDITASSRIAQLLKDLKQSRTLLNVTVPGHQGSYTSAILDIDLKRGLLILDELNPELGHKRFLETGQLRVNTQLKQVKLRFSAELKGAGSDQGVAFYQVPIPTSVYYAQNRAHFRIQIRVNERPPVTLTSAGGNRITGEVLDLSLGGAGLMFAKGTPLEPGDHFPACKIVLPKGGELVCAAFVRYVREAQQANKLRAGIQFSGLDPRQERLLQSSVTYLQRRLLSQ